MIVEIFNKIVTKQFIIYGLVGTFVTILKLVVLFVLRDLLMFETYFSVTISYIVAVLTHFFINKHFTFKIKERNVLNLMTIKYLASLFIAFLFYIGNIWIFNHFFKFYISVFIALFLSFIFNYFLYKNVVFIQK